MELALNSGSVSAILSAHWVIDDDHMEETVPGSAGSCHTPRKHLEPWTHGPEKPVHSSNTVMVLLEARQ